MQRRSRVNRMVLTCGLVLVFIHVILLLLSPHFSYGSSLSRMPIAWWVGLEVAAGAVYLIAVLSIVSGSNKDLSLITVIAVGALMRGLFLFSTPVLEDDFYRYLWDGKLVAQGFNPYFYAPAEIRAGTGRGDELGMLTDIAGESEPVFSRINHPQLRTIYPPLAQAVFGVSAWVKPWNLTTWRLTLLLFDILTLWLLIKLLQMLGSRLDRVVVYWWNPVLIKETINSAHMDILLAPLLLLLVYFSIVQRRRLAAVCIALASAIKLWPLLLLPTLLRWSAPNVREAVATILLVMSVTAALLLPMILSPMDPTSGLVAYAQQWKMNGALFHLIDSLASEPMVSRWVVLGIVAAFIAYLNRGPVAAPEDLINRMLLSIAALFLLSPTGYPWYYIWLLPFLTLAPRISLLSLSVLLPLYYLRFWFDARDVFHVFENRILWLEFAPVWLLLIWEWYAKRVKG